MKTVSEIDNLRRQLADSTARVEALSGLVAGVTGVHLPWPLVDVLSKLKEAATVLLHEKNYDGLGYEEIGAAVEYVSVYTSAVAVALSALTASAPTDAGQADAGAESAKAVTGWLPIETAPKDEPILAWRESWISPFIAENSYRGWRQSNGASLVYPPTHWMPIPPVPATPPETTEVRAVEPQAEQAKNPPTLDEHFGQPAGSFAKFVDGQQIAPGHNPDKLTNEESEARIGDPMNSLERSYDGGKTWHSIMTGPGELNEVVLSHAKKCGWSYRRRVTPSEGKGAK